MKLKKQLKMLQNTDVNIEEFDKSQFKAILMVYTPARSASLVGRTM